MIRKIITGCSKKEKFNIAWENIREELNESGKLTHC
jgi:hypothetical protein